MKQTLIIIHLFFFSWLNVHAQKDIRYTSSIGLSGTIEACNSITLGTNFTFTAAEGKSLTLKVDANDCTPYPEGIRLDDSKNYIHTRTYTEESGSKYLDAIQYFDGLGRPMQTVQAAVTPAPYYNDLVSVQEYDGFGRKSRTWLPAPASSNGAYYENATAKIQNHYKDSAYSRPVYEASPLNRVLELYGPGKDWYSKEKSVKTEYLTNKNGVENGKLSCRLYKINSNGVLEHSAMYSDGELFVLKLTDEDGNISYEFKDKLGQVVLTRQIGLDNKMELHFNTFYVYDDFGNLRYVLPPMLIDGTSNYTDSNEVMKQYAYIYKYDARNRCVEKKLPGCEPILYRYDDADQLLFSQDGEQYLKPTHEAGYELKGRWSFNLYDKLDRVVIMGECENVSNPTNKGVSKATYDSSLADWQNMGYRFENLDTWYSDFYIVNYYDNYDFLKREGFSKLDYTSNEGFSTRYGDNNNTVAAKGLLTGSVIKVLDGGEGKKYIYKTFYYDEKGRVIQTKSTNHMGGVDKEFVEYNFTGQPVKKLVVHTGTYLPSGNELKEDYVYKYDHAGRLLTTVRNGETIESLAYNELGQLVGKTQGEGLANTYEYNIRGWMKKHKESKTKFEQELFYQDAPSNQAYNGNIAQMTYVQGNDGLVTTGYSYDKLNRLIESLSILHGSTYEFASEVMTYDKHGNMGSIERKLNNTYTDRLSFTSYAGNQLKTLTNSSSGTNGVNVVEYPSSTSTFGYNTNGSLISDSGREIVTTEYNSLNLPKLIQFKNGNQIKYVYASDGTKLTAVHITARQGVVQPVTNGEIRDLNKSEITNTLTTNYVGNLIHEYSSEWDDMSWAVEPQIKVLFNGGYEYVYKNYPADTYYQLKDYLGNVRASKYMSYPPFTTEYQAFGTPFRRFKGEMSSDPYKFGGKEFDRMHGLDWYDFHARQYDPVLARFHTIDPMAEKYYSISPYAYCMDNPVNAVDTDGRLVVFINGFYFGNEGGKSEYWGGFDKKAMDYLKDHNAVYYDGALGGIKSSMVNPYERQRYGYRRGTSDASYLISKAMRNNETIKIISHSFGAAYAKGFITALMEYCLKYGIDPSIIAFEADFAPHQPKKQKAVKGVPTFQFSHTGGDWIVGHIFSSHGEIKGANVTNNDDNNKGHNITDFLYQLNNLPAGSYKVEDGVIVPKK